MQSFVLWTGIYDLLAALPILIPRLFPGELPDAGALWTTISGVSTLFMGALLFLCSRRLAERAPLVAWRGVLRIAAGTIFLGYIVYGGIGADLLLAAVLDIVIGAIYLLGLPRALGTTLAAVLCDRIVIPRES